MSRISQEMCKSLDIARNLFHVNPHMRKVEKFYLGLNQTMYHYVEKYDNFVKYIVLTHGAVPRSNHPVECALFTARLPVETVLAIRIHEADAPDVNRRSIQHHLGSVAVPLTPSASFVIKITL
jgi:hypothetical protein